MYLQDAAGVEHMVVFGGRRKHDVLLDDTWEATLSWPNVTWRLVAPGRAQLAQKGSRRAVEAGAEGPAPRKGHSAVMTSDAGEAPRMASRGGRLWSRG